MGMANRLMSSEELLKRFDRNGDGRIDDDERADAREALMKEQVERQMMRTTVGSDTTPAQPDMAAMERVVRAAIEADPVQRRAFDRDADGKLSDTEWAAARERLAKHWVGATTRTPEEERRRLEAVAAEVERRRALREKGLPLTPQAPKEPKKAK